MNSATLFLLIVIVFVVLAIWSAASGSAAFETDLSPREVTTAAAQSFTTRGWVTTSQRTDLITFSKSQTPGCLVTCFLLIFGIIPGLIYWIAAKRTLTVSVGADPLQRGSAVHLAWSGTAVGGNQALTSNAGSLLNRLLLLELGPGLTRWRMAWTKQPAEHCRLPN